MPLFSEVCVFLCCSSPTIRPYGLLAGHTLAGSTLPCHIIEVFHSLFIIIFCLFIYYSFYIFCFILNRISLRPIQCAQKMPKLLKANSIAFLFIYFIAPSAAVGKNKERRLTAKTNPTKSSIITDTYRPGY